MFVINCRETEKKLMASNVKRKVKSMMAANQTEVELRRDRLVVKIATLLTNVRFYLVMFVCCFYFALWFLFNELQ